MMPDSKKQFNRQYINHIRCCLMRLYTMEVLRKSTVIYQIAFKSQIYRQIEQVYRNYTPVELIIIICISHRYSSLET